MEKQHHNENYALTIPRIVTDLDSNFGQKPESLEKPQRCRAIIFSPDGTKLLGIVRQRPEREAYAVFPGGGIEDHDISALAAVRRELAEELDLGESDVHLTGKVILFDDEVGGTQFYHVGLANSSVGNLTIHGPEADRDPAISGTYTPCWIPVSDLTAYNMQPVQIADMIQNVYRNEA